MNSANELTNIFSHLSNISSLLRSIKLSKKRVLSVLLLFNLATIFNALLEGINMLLIVSIFIGDNATVDQSRLLTKIFDSITFMGGDPQFPGIVPFLIFSLSVNLVIRVSLLYFTAYIEALLRQRIQESVFTSYLLGDWSHMRDFRVGNAVGVNTMESQAVTKYLVSAFKVIYFILSALIITIMALSTSLEISLIAGAIALPLMWLMKKIGNKITQISRLWVELRNKFSSDITDRFNGLLQIHVDDNEHYHLQQGLQSQSRFTSLEILQGLYHAGLGSFSLLLPLTVFIGFSIWLSLVESYSALNLTLIASVSVLGIRALTQLNAVVMLLGNLARLSGSIYSVLDALRIPSKPNREMIDLPVIRIEVDKISYAYRENIVIDGSTFMLKRGAPMVLSGRSGRGKTTLANLIAGLYFPSAGQILYIDKAGKAFSSANYRARIGFVTQDIYLFHGSLRSNLTSGRGCTDEKIWTALEQVDATEFVKAMGGLDAEGVESCRSLSGGQRRRLGIARVLLTDSDILIFDEITAGLDQNNKAVILKVIERLIKKYIVIVISHDALTLPNQVTYSV